ncbi:Cys-tRNA(Pro) deacylase [Salinispora arenicola]|uniref:Cys-tRNA(Pro) deacylase n=1 Tax=Salinispora arenicola TaxID=168697 RepID=UPI00169AD5CF|nr:Cys-tRNA(Pro) deacylase [Salinispora arenicola]NIL56557.1 Cys-tRNA(Pro) deacylase [Salinispora arenicola]NIL61665.1 Cys-tRNA(Pro) deacylase [Salinispora arenicola]
MARRQATPATTLLNRREVKYRTHPYDVPVDAPNYGALVAATLGLPPDRVFKSLVAVVDGALTIVVVPVTGELGLKALAAAVGAKRAVLADRATAERATGYVRGGISPLGQRRNLPTVLDESALHHETIYVSAGRRGLQLELAPQDLVALTNARTARVASA